MILTCNSCGKKFVVPDSAITASGRTVQCGSCGNKWKQFPTNETKKAQPVLNLKKNVSKPKSVQQKKIKKNITKKPREISLYSPEYLAKKHGIKLNDSQTNGKVTKKKHLHVSFGFYNSLILFIFLIIFLARSLYFGQNFVITILPSSEFYLNYFFESVRNIFEIVRDLLIIY